MKPDKSKPVYEKPPIGLTPKDVWEQLCIRDRISDILGAMHRYARVGKPIPYEWVEELSILLEPSLFPYEREEE